jgi:hypothetical protein
MVRFMSILSFAAVLGCLALATTADAQNSSPALPPAPTTCTNSSGTVKVTLVGSAPASCPTNPSGLTQCLKWSYLYELLGSGSQIKLAAITVDSDLTIVAATGSNPATSPESGAGITVFNAGESSLAINNIGRHAFDFRAVQFAASAPKVLGHVYTSPDVGAGSVTAITGIPGASTCRIAGPDDTSTGSTAVGVASTTTTQIDQFQGCEITLGLDPKGCPSTINVTGEGCSVVEDTLLGGQTFLGGNCRLGNGLVTHENPTCIWYCPTSSGTCFKVCK